MKHPWFDWRREKFSTRLMVGLVLLVLATTLGAGLPAYWLTSNQLEVQTWNRVADAQTTTLSLLAAHQTRIEDARLLFVERPTLHLLMMQDRPRELEEYITNFTRRSGIDLLLVCDATGAPVAGDRMLGSCPAQEITQFTTIHARPVLLTSSALAEPLPSLTTPRAVVGLWLDDAFLQQLAATTGVEQSLLAPDGSLLASSLGNRASTSPSEPRPRPSTNSTSYTYQIDDIPFFAWRTPVVNSDGQVGLFSEVALSVELLQQTERRAISILLASTGILALTGLALGILYIRRLTTPLHALTTSAEAIAVGHLTAPIPSFRAPHEVAILARALAASQQSLLAALGERSQARDWLLALLQSVVEGVITLDREGRITFFSQGAENLSGWSSQEALGHTIDEVFPPANAEDGTFYQAIPAPGQRRRLEVMARSGEVVALAITGTRLAPLVSDGTTPSEAQTALVVRDVSDEEVLDQMHSYFLANLTHEFQTPLSTLSASLELLMENAGELSSDDLRALLRPAHLSLLGLQNLVNNLLASSAVDVGRFTLRMRPTNLHQVIAHSLQLVQPLFERRQQIFTLGEATTLASDSEIQADPARLTLALVNLLTNASKYSPDGATIDLAVTDLTVSNPTVNNPTGREQGQWLRLAVADRGPGVPLAAHSQLFNRFARLDAPESEQASTGLGLFVVKTTVEAHGGRVGIDDRPGGGAIFWLEIPRIAEVKDENSDRRRRSRVVRHSSLHVTPRRLRGRPRL